MMIGLALFVSSLVTAGLQTAAPPDRGTLVVDNERVTVWTITPDPHAPLANRSSADRVEISLGGSPSSVVFRKKDAPGPAKSRPGPMVLIELKDIRVPPLSNESGYPNAFPRPRSRRVLENDRIIVWDYSWRPGDPTSMHFHDKDVVVVYLEDGALRSTTPGGDSVVNEYPKGTIRFNKRDRAHTEELVKGRQRAIIVELK